MLHLTDECYDAIAAMTSWCEAVSQYQEDARTPSPLGGDLQLVLLNIFSWLHTVNLTRTLIFVGSLIVAG